MENDALLKRVNELRDRSIGKQTVTHTAFLTPAECAVISKEAARFKWDNMLLTGGGVDNERRMCFFLPDYIEPEDFTPDEYISALEASSPFSKLTHRDYLGALMGLGIERDCVGDIYVSGESAYFYLLPTVLNHVLLSFDKAGRHGIKLRQIPLSAVPQPEVQVREITFTVNSLRLDAAVSGLFRISRSKALQLISAGAVRLNYIETLKADAHIAEGDILSVHKLGKGRIAAIGGLSQKGRQFVTGEIYK